MAPISGSKVIPPQWEEHHRPVAASTMTAEAVIRRPGGVAPYPPDPNWDPSGEVLWRGQARVQELKQPTTSFPADQPTYGRLYLVTLPIDSANPLPDLHVGEQGDVVHAVGQVLRLNHPMAGSLLWERDYVAYINHTQEG